MSLVSPSHLLIMLLGLLAAGCERSVNPFEEPLAPEQHRVATGENAAAKPPGSAEDSPGAASGAVVWDLGMSLLSESYNEAGKLISEVDALLASPSAQRLEKAQQQWLKTATSYERFYLFTRLGLVQPRSHLALLDHHSSIAAWPVQPGFLDAFGDYPRSGIVFDVDLPITETQIRRQHGLTDASDVALGLYALHFGLFGEVGVRDLAALTAVPELTQAQRDEGYIHVKELPNNRRRELLRLQAELLRVDLTQMGLAWQASRTALTGWPQQQWQTAMIKAALAMVTEQLLALSEHSISIEGPQASLGWQNQQLAQRLSAQLEGWQQVLALLNESQKELAGPLTQAAVTQLQDWQMQPEQGEAPLRQIHQSLRNLASTLQAQVEVI